MKFLKWLFGFGSKYRKKEAKYALGGVGSRIGTIATMIFMAGGTLVLEWFLVDVYTGAGLLAGILCTLALIALLFETAEYATMYGVIGFRYAILNTAADIGRKAFNKKAQKETSQLEERDPNVVAMLNTVAEENKKKRSHKWLDLLVGVLGLVISAGIMVAAVLMIGLKAGMLQ